MKLRAAVITDDLKLAQWQLDALEEANQELEIVCILNCLNTKIKKNFFKHFLYYLISFFALRNQKTKAYLYRPDGIQIIEFKSRYTKNWQSIPDEVLNELLDINIEVIIKFGMNLLTVDNKLDKLNVLSFHHGNPARYRGRPAGFYEILNREKQSGVIVQRISNELDAGKIFAFAESKVLDFSYKKTSLNFYDISKYLLKIAIVNMNNNAEMDILKNGNVYSLPSNLTSLQFLLQTTFNLSKKLLYGIFVEKIWKVAIFDNCLDFKGREIILKKSLTKIPIKDGYNFYADPFFSIDGKHLRLEALGKKSGIGDILQIPIESLDKQKVILSGKHFSYPFSFKYNDYEYLMPEVANHSNQFAFKLDETKQYQLIKGLENKRVVDATLYYQSGTWYLFFGLLSNSHSVLNLWISKDFEQTFEPHPCSPISLSPSCARMGGSLAVIDKKLLRFGQNNEGEYGSSLAVNHITELSPSSYKEYSCGSIELDSSFGPHTLNINSNKITIDYYDNEFSIFAGIRRIKNRFFNNNA
jgi:hypothetical protein